LIIVSHLGKKFSPFAESKESHPYSQQHLNRHHQAILIHSTPYVFKNNLISYFVCPAIPSGDFPIKMLNALLSPPPESSSIHLITSTMH